MQKGGEAVALTAKQKRFADEYLVDLNATQAALRAGYSGRTAYSIGQENLKKPVIAQYIAEAQQKRAKRTEITQDMVVSELARVAFSNGTDFAKVVRQDGHTAVELVPTGDLPEDKRAAIAGIRETQNGIEVKSCDKLKALELLGRHLGMFKDKVEITDTESTGWFKDETPEP